MTITESIIMAAIIGVIALLVGMGLITKVFDEIRKDRTARMEQRAKLIDGFTKVATGALDSLKDKFPDANLKKEDKKE